MVAKSAMPCALQTACRNHRHRPLVCRGGGGKWALEQPLGNAPTGHYWDVSLYTKELEKVAPDVPSSEIVGLNLV